MGGGGSCNGSGRRATGSKRSERRTMRNRRTLSGQQPQTVLGETCSSEPRSDSEEEERTKRMRCEKREDDDDDEEQENTKWPAAANNLSSARRVAKKVLGETWSGEPRSDSEEEDERTKRMRCEGRQVNMKQEEEEQSTRRRQMEGIDLHAYVVQVPR